MNDTMIAIGNMMNPRIDPNILNIKFGKSSAVAPHKILIDMAINPVFGDELLDFAVGSEPLIS